MHFSVKSLCVLFMNEKSIDVKCTNKHDVTKFVLDKISCHNFFLGELGYLYDFDDNLYTT